MESWFQTENALQFFEGLECVKAFKVSTPHAYVQGYIQAEPNKLISWFSRRAIIIGGPVLKDGVTKEEVVKLLKEVKKAASEAIYIEFRCEEDLSKYKEAFEEAGFKYQPHLNVKIKCDTEKNAFERMDENRKRQIKRATDSGIQCKYVDDVEEVNQFYTLLKQHYKTKIKKPVFPLEFFEKMVIEEYGKLLVATQNEKIIGGMLQVSTDDTIYDYYVCGLDAEYPVESPSVMLYWTTINNAISEGKSTLDTMGAGIPNVPYGVRDFKLRFGGELVEYGRYVYVNKPILYKIGCLGIKLL
ncbi:MAG: GNAT family N-acetyltransferase [Paludibacteraceae bacterium]|nr:GNAT family N-acetyltransferase [Paludibacteraceae bacterium]